MSLRINRRELGRLALGAGAAVLMTGRERGSVVLAQQPAAAQPAPQGVQSTAELTRLMEDVYVFQSLGHQSIFIVTEEGVIATDPIGQSNPRSPQLYRAAIAAVTDQPVRYVICSHDHRDHNEGGFVFAEEAQFVAHRRAAEKIAARPDSQAGRSPVPTMLFDESMALDLGGKRVELQHVGRNHSDNSIVLIYPAGRLIFAVDFVSVNSLPGAGGLRLAAPQGAWDLYPDEWIESLARVESMDFDVVVPGHPPLSGTKADVPFLRGYLQDSKAAFAAAKASGAADNSDAMTSSMNEALAPKYGQISNYAAAVPLIAQAWARAAAGGV